MENNQNQKGQGTQDTIPFKAFTNEEEYNNEIKSISSKAKGEMLKELGVNNLAEIKDMQSEYAELVKSQKTSEELKEEELNALKLQNEKLANKLLDQTIKTELDIVLDEYEIADEYKVQAKQNVFDLLNKKELIEGDKIKQDELKARTEKLIEDRFPMFKKQTKKAGIEIPPAKTTTSNVDYLKQKYKDNPWFTRIKEELRNVNYVWKYVRR